MPTPCAVILTMLVFFLVAVAGPAATQNTRIDSFEPAK
jgi:hypothetical protein